jgi:hypothetical protein
MIELVRVLYDFNLKYLIDHGLGQELMSFCQLACACLQPYARWFKANKTQHTTCPTIGGSKAKENAAYDMKSIRTRRADDANGSM